MFIRREVAVSAVVVMLCGFCGLAYCQSENTALLIQQTPAEGGQVNLGAGVHRFAPNTQITLAATPKPGYQFVYWMGDVSDTAASRTSVYLDTPKIIIAVFEKVKQDIALIQAGPTGPAGGGQPRRGGGGGRGGLIASGVDYARGGFSGGGGGVGELNQQVVYNWTLPSKEEPPEPEGFPVPVPEPATGMLLLFGGLYIFGRRRCRMGPLH